MGSKGNPDGVVLAMYCMFSKEFKREESISELLFGEHSGFRNNASNEECIFYYDETMREGSRIRLLDECDSIQREWISTSTAWKEIEPFGNEESSIMKKLMEFFMKDILKNNKE